LSPNPSSGPPRNLPDRINEFTGRLLSWLTLLMVLVTAVIVVMRYAFDAGMIWMQESVTWMHAAVFMVGAGYTLLYDEHVRVDIFYRSMSRRRRGWVDLLGVLLFLLPLCAWLAWSAIDFAAASWSIHESSREPGGMPYPFIPILKSLVVLMPALVALQGISLAMRSLHRIRRG
jgi:TRAP-type mannitol/chloroaromatic compound transport system permease small subunit